jgi:hypothetical protein
MNLAHAISAGFRTLTAKASRGIQPLQRAGRVSSSLSKTFVFTTKSKFVPSLQVLKHNTCSILLFNDDFINVLFSTTKIT